MFKEHRNTGELGGPLSPRPVEGQLTVSPCSAGPVNTRAQGPQSPIILTVVTLPSLPSPPTPSDGPQAVLEELCWVTKSDPLRCPDADNWSSFWQHNPGFYDLYKILWLESPLWSLSRGGYYQLDSVLRSMDRGQKRWEWMWLCRLS